jgi:hypothetical protein
MKNPDLEFFTLSEAYQKKEYKNRTEDGSPPFHINLLLIIVLAFFMYSVINHKRTRHSRESGNPGKHWIPGQARNDKPAKIYVVMYK